MRVITGKYRGRRLACPKSGVRPTTDRVKEAMFGAIQFDLTGAAVLDAFAGSGALGIEALSRGAAHVDFVEIDSECLKTLESNLKSVEADNFRIYRGDVIRLMPSLSVYDIMLLDPPYDDGLYYPVLEAAEKQGKLKEGARIIAECRRTFDFQAPLGYNLTKRKNYGDISLFFMEYGESN